MLKGKSVIELTDVKTNIVERYEEENLVTNAVPDLLRLNPSGLMYPIELHSAAVFEKELFPIANKCYGGILLFENPLKEDPNQYIAPSDNPIIGYASNDVNATDNPKRGSANLTESTPIENGYKFVWDFSTSQANGKISSLALTHYKGGVSYYGDPYGKEGAIFMLNNTSKNVGKETLKLYVGMVEADPVQNVFISLWPLENQSLEIIRCKEAFSTIGLNDSITGMAPQQVEKRVIGISEFYRDVSPYQWSKSGFFDGRDGYYYGFIVSTESSKGTNLNRVKIKKEDASTTIDHWFLEGVRIQRFGDYPSKDSYRPSYTRYSLVKEGYLYTMNLDNTKIIKFNINNPVDLAEIDLGFTANYQGGEFNYSYIYAWGDYILGNQFVLNRNETVIKTPSTKFFRVATPTITIGPFILGYGSYTGYDNTTLYKILHLHTPYLGTINNLSTPILKTADKTMKITYTLTEEP